MSDTETGTCHVCGEEAPVDGKHAVERFGNVLCWDCSGKPVKFVAECDSGFCSWFCEVEDTQFNRGHAKRLAQQEANRHQRARRIFDDDPCHKTDVREVDAVAQ